MECASSATMMCRLSARAMLFLITCLYLANATGVSVRAFTISFFEASSASMARSRAEIAFESIASFSVYSSLVLARNSAAVSTSASASLISLFKP
jgi:hypothetical protein